MNHLISYKEFSLNENFIEEPQHVALYEGFSETMQFIEDAIRNKLVCKIDYRGDPEARRRGDVLSGIRVIEPYALGVNGKGNNVVRAWLIMGVSKTGRRNPRLVPGWRLFRIDRIRSITTSLEKFTVPKKGYNRNDKGMTQVMFAATF